MRVLVIDDDEGIRVALRRALALEGHDPILAEDAASGLRQLRDSPPAAIVLDWMLPDVDGVEVCRRIRAAGDDVPIIMLTARAQTADRIEGLDAGADDFLPKPFDVDELMARLRALLRRPRTPESSPVENGAQLRFQFADLVLDAATYSVHRGGRRIELTRTEFMLLEVFMRRPGVVMSRGALLHEVWGYDFGGNDGNLDVYVSYLRRKTEAGGATRVIHTVRGVGFALREGL